MSAAGRMACVHDRLAQLRPGGAGSAAWDERWGDRDLPRLLEEARQGGLDEMEPLFERWLPPEARILEAGCGWGRFMAALSARGYEIEGVDFASETIERIRAVAPELSVRVGDILALDVPDGSYDAYLSFGVLEHRLAGPQAGLAECARILRSGGRAFISVPHLNRPRARVLEGAAPWDEKDAAATGLDFYQYYFALPEFSDLIAEAGLRLVDCVPQALMSGFTRDWRLGRWLEKRSFFHWRIRRRLRRMAAHGPRWAGRRWAHMMMYVCEKP